MCVYAHVNVRERERVTVEQYLTHFLIHPSGQPGT